MSERVIVRVTAYVRITGISLARLFSEGMRSERPVVLTIAQNLRAVPLSYLMETSNYGGAARAIGEHHDGSETVRVSAEIADKIKSFGEQCGRSHVTVRTGPTGVIDSSNNYRAMTDGGYVLEVSAKWTSETLTIPLSDVMKDTDHDFSAHSRRPQDCRMCTLFKSAHGEYRASENLVSPKVRAMAREAAKQLRVSLDGAIYPETIDGLHAEALEMNDEYDRMARGTSRPMEDPHIILPTEVPLSTRERGMSERVILAVTAYVRVTGSSLARMLSEGMRPDRPVVLTIDQNLKAVPYSVLLDAGKYGGEARAIGGYHRGTETVRLSPEIADKIASFGLEHGRSHVTIRTGTTGVVSTDSGYRREPDGGYALEVSAKWNKEGLITPLETLTIPLSGVLKDADHAFEAHSRRPQECRTCKQTVSTHGEYRQTLDLGGRVRCGCEHTSHFNDDEGSQTGHEYQAVPAGDRAARYVGPVCNECARTCMADHLIKDAPAPGVVPEFPPGVDPTEFAAIEWQATRDPEDDGGIGARVTTYAGRGKMVGEDDGRILVLLDGELTPRRIPPLDVRVLTVDELHAEALREAAKRAFPDVRITVKPWLQRAWRMPIGVRGPVHESEPDRPDNGKARRWRRTINGTPYGFTVVNMPDGELRLIVRKYNGYGDDGTEEGRARGMRFGCAWSQVHWITLRPERATREYVVRADDETLTVQARDIIHASQVARAMRPDAVVISDTAGQRAADVTGIAQLSDKPTVAGAVTRMLIEGDEEGIALMAKNARDEQPQSDPNAILIQRGLATPRRVIDSLMYSGVPENTFAINASCAGKYETTDDGNTLICHTHHTSWPIATHGHLCPVARQQADDSADRARVGELLRELNDAIETARAQHAAKEPIRLTLPLARIAITSLSDVFLPDGDVAVVTGIGDVTPGNEEKTVISVSCRGRNSAFSVERLTIGQDLIAVAEERAREAAGETSDVKALEWLLPPAEGSAATKEATLPVMARAIGFLRDYEDFQRNRAGGARADAAEQRAKASDGRDKDRAAWCLAAANAYERDARTADRLADEIQQTWRAIQGAPVTEESK